MRCPHPAAGLRPPPERRQVLAHVVLAHRWAAPGGAGAVRDGSSWPRDAAIARARSSSSSSCVQKKTNQHHVM